MEFKDQKRNASEKTPTNASSKLDPSSSITSQRLLKLTLPLLQSPRSTGRWSTSTTTVPRTDESSLIEMVDQIE